MPDQTAYPPAGPWLDQQGHLWVFTTHPARGPAPQLGRNQPP
jgi:hypothetical protein